MRWLDELPWWVTYAFAGGVGLMGAFASTILPTAWQDYGFWAGVGLCIFSVLGTGLHLWRTHRLQSNSVLPDRMPLTQFRDEAAKQGWDFSSDHSLHILDFTDALRQGGLDGAFKIWGRKHHPGFDVLTHNEPLNLIPIDYWKDWAVDATSLVDATDNFVVTTYWILGDARKRFQDVHIERARGLNWLKTGARSFKGRRKD